jgi:hypothetical protein
LAALAEVTPRCETNEKIGVLYNMQQFGLEHPDILAKYEKFFEQFLNDSTLSGYAKSALDLIHGRRYEDNSKY